MLFSRKISWKCVIVQLHCGSQTVGGSVQGMWPIRGEVTRVENLPSVDFRVHYTDFPLTSCLECLWEGQGNQSRDLEWPRCERGGPRQERSVGFWPLQTTHFAPHTPPPALLGSPRPRLLIPGRPVGQDSGRSASSHHSDVASLPLEWPLTPKDIYKGKNNMMI